MSPLSRNAPRYQMDKLCRAIADEYSVRVNAHTFTDGVSELDAVCVGVGADVGVTGRFSSAWRRAERVDARAEVGDFVRAQTEIGQLPGVESTV